MDQSAPEYCGRLLAAPPQNFDFENFSFKILELKILPIKLVRVFEFFKLSTSLYFLAVLEEV